MTAQRFLALVAAYGADRRRWPDGERAAAEAFVQEYPEIARPALDDADATDGLLFTSPNPGVGMDLRDRVLADAMATTGLATGGLAARAGRRWVDRLGLVLGAGWAAAACAGVVAGAMMTSHVTADVRADAALYEASLIGLDDTEVLG